MLHKAVRIFNQILYSGSIFLRVSRFFREKKYKMQKRRASRIDFFRIRTKLVNRKRYRNGHSYLEQEFNFPQVSPFLVDSQLLSFRSPCSPLYCHKFSVGVFRNWFDAEVGLQLVPYTFLYKLFTDF